MVAPRTVYAALAAVVSLACSSERQSADGAADQSVPQMTTPSAASAPAIAPQSAMRERRDEYSTIGAGAAGKIAGRELSAAAAAPPAPPAAEPAPGGPEQAILAPDPTAPAMIIRTGFATLQVDSLETGLGRVQQLVQGVSGAYIANTSMESAENQTRRATIEIKIPAAQFDRVVAGLRPIGKVEAVNVTAQDVGEEFVDVTARTENARRLEARLVDLLARRTGKLDEVLRVERELARVREEIERYEGRLRFLRSRAAMSTLAVNLHEPPPILGDRPAGNPLAEAFRRSWRNFVAFIAGFISLLGVLVPVGVLAYLAWLAGRRFLRRPLAPAPAPPAPAPATGD